MFQATLLPQTCLQTDLPHRAHSLSYLLPAAGRLIFELGGIPERELEKLKEEATRLGKSSFAFAFYMVRLDTGVCGLSCSGQPVSRFRTKSCALPELCMLPLVLQDTQKEERARGVTIACTTKEFYTAIYHYTIIDAPGT